MLKGDRLFLKSLSEREKEIITWSIIFIIVIFVATIRVRLLDVPLERDEAEYACSARLLLKGIPLYTESYEFLKLPGVYASYALFLKVFGDSVRGIHAGLLFVNISTVIIMFFFAKRLLNDTITALLTCTCFAFMSLSQHLLGFTTNAEPVLLLPAVGGILWLRTAIEKRRAKDYFISGLMLGTAFIIKQPAILFIAFCGLYLIYGYSKEKDIDMKRSLREVLIFSSGAVLPFIAVCLILVYTGVFDEFWFWTVEYALVHGSRNSPMQALNALKMVIPLITKSTVIFWLFALFGLFSIFFDHDAKKHAMFVGTFFLFSIFATSLGLYFRPHYFILMLPAVSLTAGLGVSSFVRLLNSESLFIKRALPFILMIMAVSFMVIKERTYLFKYTPDEVSRSTYGANPFVEAKEIARYIKEHTNEYDTIAVVGSEPEIYFYADRRAATKYCVIYTMTGEHKYALDMQKEMITEIMTARPKFIVYVRIPTSWTVRPGSERLIFNWAERYIPENYDRVGVVDIVFPEPTKYYWDDDAKEHIPESDKWIFVMRRKV